MLRIIFISFALLVLATVSILGLRGQASELPPLQVFPDMVDQPKYKPQGQSAFFADGRMMRPQPAGVVAWGRNAAQADEAFLRKDEDYFAATTIPLPLDRDLLMRGQLQYNTYCAVCHGAAGEGNGITTQYNMINPPTYHNQRLRQATPGYLFQVITNGKGTMGPYGGNIKAEDRWAIVAYIRALQRAQNGTINDVPEALRGELDR